MRITFIVTFAIIAYLVSTDIYTPSMPSIAHYFGKSSDDVQYTLTSFFLGAVISCFFCGYLADRWGKTRISNYGSLLAFAGALLSLLAPNLESLIAGRFFLGMGSSVAPVVGLAILQESLPEEKTLKVFGMMGIAFAAIPAVAPVVGGIMDSHFGWRSNFFIIMILMLATLVLNYLFLESVKPSQHQHKTSLIESYKQVLFNREYMAYATVNPILYAGEWALFSVLPFYTHQFLDMDADTYGWFLGAMIVWFAIGSYLGGKLVKYFGIDRVIWGGYAGAALGGLTILFTSFVFPSSVIMIYVGSSLFILCFGLMYPASVPKALSIFTHLKGTASSIRGMLITMVSFLGTSAAVLIDDSQLSQLAWFVLGVVLIGFSMFVILRHRSNTA